MSPSPPPSPQELRGGGETKHRALRRATLESEVSPRRGCPVTSPNTGSPPATCRRRRCGSGWARRGAEAQGASPRGSRDTRSPPSSAVARGRWGAGATGGNGEARATWGRSHGLGCKLEKQPFEPPPEGRASAPREMRSSRRVLPAGVPLRTGAGGRLGPVEGERPAGRPPRPGSARTPESRAPRTARVPAPPPARTHA